MTLYIKNMVCARCIRTVNRLLDESGIAYQKVQLGEVILSTPPNTIQLQDLHNRLKSEGFELLDDRNSQLVTQIKSLVINEIHHATGKKTVSMNFSDFIALETGHEYSQLSKLFSSIEGQTIEKYIIAQKIERVKELLVYNEYSLSEIAWQTGYSSSQHLSNQFRQVTGMTPSQFKIEHRHHGRKHLDTM